MVSTSGPSCRRGQEVRGVHHVAASSELLGRRRAAQAQLRWTTRRGTRVVRVPGGSWSRCSPRPTAKRTRSTSRPGHVVTELAHVAGHAGVAGEQRGHVEGHPHRSSAGRGRDRRRVRRGPGPGVIGQRDAPRRRGSRPPSRPRTRSRCGAGARRWRARSRRRGWRTRSATGTRRGGRFNRRSIDDGERRRRRASPPTPDLHADLQVAVLGDGRVAPLSNRCPTPADVPSPWPSGALGDGVDAVPERSTWSIDDWSSPDAVEADAVVEAGRGRGRDGDDHRRHEQQRELHPSGHRPPGGRPDGEEHDDQGADRARRGSG